MKSRMIAALECLEKSPYTYYERNIVTTRVTPFLIRSSSILQLTRAHLDEFEFRPDPVTDYGVSCLNV